MSKSYSEFSICLLFNSVLQDHSLKELLFRFSLWTESMCWYISNPHWCFTSSCVTAAEDLGSLWSWCSLTCFTTEGLWSWLPLSVPRAYRAAEGSERACN